MELNFCTSEVDVVKVVVGMRWTKEEDARLVDAVTSFGAGNWNRIAKCVESRSAAQCNARWVHHEAPDLNFAAASHAEDIHIARGMHNFGRSWKWIAASMQNRSSAAVKNRGQTLKSRKVCAASHPGPATTRTLHPAVCARGQQQP